MTSPASTEQKPITLVFNNPRAFLNGLPQRLPEHSVKEVFIVKFLEFLDGQERIDFFNRLDVSLMPGAIVHVTVPYWSHPQSVANPMLKFPPFSEHSFLFLSRTFREEKPDHDVPEITCNLDIMSYEYDMENDWSTRHDSARAFGLQHYLNIATTLHMALVKPGDKDQSDEQE